MKISNVTPADVQAVRAGTVTPADVPTVRAGSVTSAEQGPPSAADIVPTADLADIRPLDIAAALQILLAEVRAGLELQLAAAAAPGASPPSAATAATATTAAIATTAGAIAPGPDQAAREMVEMFLQALPEDAIDAPAWTAALVRADAAMQSSIEQAMGIVTQWRDVSAAAIDALADTRALFIAALGDDPQNPLWLRPEWMGLAPMLHRFRRRRRNARRRLTDPDYSTQSLDETEEFR
jgi:hypothetical protein